MIGAPSAASRRAYESTSSTTKTTSAAGVKTTPILPIPTTPRSWGETDLESLQNGSGFKFDEGKDVAPP